MKLCLFFICIMAPFYVNPVIAEVEPIADYPIIPSAHSNTGEALTPRQKKADAQAASAPSSLPDIQAAESITSYKGPNARNLQAQAISDASITEEAQASPFVDAFTESFGGIVRDIYRATNAAKGSENVDPNYDVGVYRDAFRKKYDIETWDMLERTKNKEDYDALITNLESKAKHDSILSNSLAGTIAGSLFDPILILGIIFLAFIYSRSKIKTISN